MTQQIERRPRREALQRIQIGLIGLGAVLLVVAFVNIVAKTMRPESAPVATLDGPSRSGTTSVNVTTSADSEPFADLGVTPAPVAPSVPDLEPDPRLSKPMDRDPAQRPQQAAPQR